MADIAIAERRKYSRNAVEGLLVSVRRKGRIGKLTGMAVDFNRHGLGLVLDQPLAKDCTVYLSICSVQAKIDNVIGVVHNCVSQDVGYRCGIQFRTASTLQSDKASIEEQLLRLEETWLKQSA